MFKKLVFRWHNKFLDGFTSLKYGFRPGQCQITDAIAAVAGLIIIDARPILKTILSYDVASGSELTPCNIINKPLVVYRFTGNAMTSLTTLRT